MAQLIHEANSTAFCISVILVKILLISIAKLLNFDSEDSL